MNRYLEDQKQILKRSSAAAAQERKGMKAELNGEGVRTIIWCRKEQAVMQQHGTSTLRSLDRDTVTSEGSNEEEVLVIKQDEGEN